MRRIIDISVIICDNIISVIILSKCQREDIYFGHCQEDENIGDVQRHVVCLVLEHGVIDGGWTEGMA